MGYEEGTNGRSENRDTILRFLIFHFMLAFRGKCVVENCPLSVELIQQSLRS